MATAHNDDDFGSELPPPAYQLTDVEVDRKIADAAHRSLNETPQPTRPTLPPIDEDGFPLWDEALFEYNKLQREREREEQNSKLRSEYAPRPTATSVPSAASSSSSPPQVHAQVQPMRALSPVAQSKQKDEGPRWYDNNNSGRIMQDDDLVPEMAGLNVGRPPAHYTHTPLPNPPYAQTQVQTQNQARPAIQVQVGPRPHDVLAQPTSPVSDPEDDPLPAGGASGLGRAPTYRPMGQAHPGHTHVRAATDRAPVGRSSTESTMSRGSADLPAWTAVAPSLEGPAYEEVVGNQARRPTSRGSSVGSGAGGAGTREWQPVQARPQVQERVAGARRSTGAPVGPSGGVPYAPSAGPAHASSTGQSNGRAAPPAPAQTWTASPSTYTPVSPTPMLTTTYTPLGSASRSGGFAYRASQQPYTLGAGLDYDASMIVEAQSALDTEGANAFYPVAVASMMKTKVEFKAPPPPPARVRSPVEDDRSSVFSGRSGGRQGSVYSNGGGPRMSVYNPGMGGLLNSGPGNGVMSGGGVNPSLGLGDAGNRMSYVPQFQPGAQVPGAGGYQSNFQSGTYQPPIQAGGYQPQPQQATTAPGQFQYQPQAAPPQTPLAYQPQSPASIPVQQAPAQQAPMTYQPQTYRRPLPVPGAGMGGGIFAATGGPGVQAGGYAPAAPNAGRFIQPPPPPAASQLGPGGPGGFVQPGRKPGKLYKRL